MIAASLPVPQAELPAHGACAFDMAQRSLDCGFGLWEFRQAVLAPERFGAPRILYPHKPVGFTVADVDVCNLHAHLIKHCNMPE